MSARPKLLLVDDGDRYVELAHALLRGYEWATLCDLPGPCWECERRPGCTLTHARDHLEAERALRRHRDVSAVLLDVCFDVPVERLTPSEEPDLERRRRLEGVQILSRIRRLRGDLPVVLMTSREELDLEGAGEELTADEYVTLAGADAFDARAMGLLVERVLARRRHMVDAGGYVFGDSAAMARLRRDATALARTSLPILLLGETGTGKSALAEKVIHEASGRQGPFVAVDLSAIPETLVAAELFGTARGAFSGAVERRGRFEMADGGTLLLDEIGNLRPDVQRMLLLALQDGRITRLGESAPRRVDVKLVAATNADLAGAVRAGSFRADLYARLNPAARLTLPPLRERRADVEALAQAFVSRTFTAGADRALLQRYMDAAGLSGAPSASLVVGTPTGPRGGVTFALTRASFAAIAQHSFPGNVRELGLLMANTTVFALTDALTAAEEGRAVAEAAGVVPVPPKLVRELLEASWIAPEGGTPGGADPGDLEPAAELRDVARELERRLFVRLFEATGGDFEAMAARLLTGDPAENARRVRLRFNQLGLSVKALRHR